MNEAFLHNSSIFSSESSDLSNSDYQNCWQHIKFAKIMNIKSESLKLSESTEYKFYSSLSCVICQSVMTSHMRRSWASSRVSQKSMSESFEDSNKSIVIKSANKSKKSVKFSIQSESSTHKLSNDYLTIARKYWNQQKAARVQILANEKNLAHVQADINALIEINQNLMNKISQLKVLFKNKNNEQNFKNRIVESENS